MRQASVTLAPLAGHTTVSPSVATSVDLRFSQILAEMRKQPGRSVRHIAMVASLQTGRLAPNRY
jgi:hypothetical protein